MGEYKLSASLGGHGDDVRAVAFPDPKVVLTASRDYFVRIWRLIPTPPPTFDETIHSHGSSFINCLAYAAPSKEYPQGLVISGSKDAIIEVRQPGKPAEENADALLLGHGANVCTVDIDPSGTIIVSGGWDNEARVWQVGKWECEAVLQGHQGTVWAVIAWDKNTIITGCADKLIRVFHTSGKLLRTIKGCTDVIRAICRVPTNHPSGADIASASNDGIIRLWSLEGRQLGQLQGHESFIYSLAALPSGELASAGEDRTVRIWKGSQCVQTITHPAISVWGVSVCAENGDIVSGASDRIARVFTRDERRRGTPEALKAFDESVTASSIPQQQVGEIKKDQLPGPEFLIQKSGTKEGQVQMIREANGSVTAHQWSVAAHEWTNVGTVVDAVGSSGKKTDYLGVDYDYVFDVDIKEGEPPLKLPYNLSQNPYEAATKFIQDNELPMTYLDEVTNFITKNTQGATIGTQQQVPSGADPWGTESRYRPGETNSSSAQSISTERPKVLPQKSYLAIEQANIKTIQKKILELNEALKAGGDKDLSLNPSEISILTNLIGALERSNPQKDAIDRSVARDLPLVIKTATEWPPAQRLPGLDLVRLMAAKWPGVASYEDHSGQNIVGILGQTGTFADQDRSNNIMLAVRAFANLFQTEQGRALVDEEFTEIHSLVHPLIASSVNRNLTIALTTLYINFSVLLTSPTHAKQAKSADRAITMLDDLTAILRATKDSEAIYRALVAAGTLLSLGEEAQEAAKSIYDLPSAADAALKKASEPRIQGIVKEIKALLV